MPPEMVAAIVTTYNRPDALAAVLEGFLAQTDRRFEVIVADDGSTGETRDTIAAHAARSPVPIRHVWQEHHGFAAGAMRNRALAVAGADYVVFIDGDCIPPPGFIATHRRLAEPGWFLSGNRVLLEPALTRRILEQRLPAHLWSRGVWLRQRLARQVNRLLPLLTLPDGRLRKARPQRWRGVKTCNLSAWRADLERVNGFDESYAGWGLEDSDLVIRLLRAGLRRKSARFAAPVFHLWHPPNDRAGLAANQHRLDALLQGDRIEAVLGLRQAGGADRASGLTRPSPADGV